MNKVSIIIPVYNEEERIGSTLINCVSYFSKRYQNNFEIVVILNGCTDSTQEVVENCCINFSQVKCYTYQKRLGKRGALIEGFKKANGEIIAYTDADGAIK